MTRPQLPTRRLPEKPNLEQLKRQAKELLQAFKEADPRANAEVHAQYRDADPRTFALHDAQLVIARAYGFESWPRLKAFVDGATVRRLVDAVLAGRIAEVRALLEVRPELARMSVSNFQVLHYAVLERAPEMVRLLMEHGANAREGVYPHREATTAHAIASSRGYSEIVAIIEEEERKRRESMSGVAGVPPGEELFRAITSRDSERAIALLNSNPALVNTRHSTFDASPLLIAAHALDPKVVAALLDGGATAAARGHHGLTPLDAAAQAWYMVDQERFAATATLLLKHGAPMTAAAAVALGDIDWLRARHAEGTLENQIEDAGGLLRIAVTHNRLAILALLLDFGFDPDERMRFSEGDDPAFSWGMPLQQAVLLRRYEMADLLLQRGADPNASIYASGDPIMSAYELGDQKMIALLERHGGVPTATTAGLFRKTELAARMIAGEASYRLDGVGGESVGEQLLGGATRGGDPEIVRRVLAGVNWAPDDRRWFTLLEQTLRHSSSESAGQDGDVYLACFRLLLERCDPNLRGRPTDEGQFGLTTLHNIVARGNIKPEERVAYAAAALDKGARLDLRDNLLQSTPLGWACRWRQAPLVKLFLDRGADPVEADAEPWARPRAWAGRMNHPEILSILDRYR